MVLKFNYFKNFKQILELLKIINNYYINSNVLNYLCSLYWNRAEMSSIGGIFNQVCQTPLITISAYCTKYFVDC